MYYHFRKGAAQSLRHRVLRMERPVAPAPAILREERIAIAAVSKHLFAVALRELYWSPKRLENRDRLLRIGGRCHRAARRREFVTVYEFPEMLVSRFRHRNNCLCDS